ncbi:MAG: uracil-DNA glycosylase [Gammaproteobacteria bacterium]|nr:uracil-DNA glycosylase [Gammaproteobacteria bacterium]
MPTSDVERKRATLEALGVTAWVRRVPPSAAPVPPNLEAALPCVTAPASLPSADWDGLALEVAACTKCSLHAGRTQTVFGVGNHAAEWLVIGEAPGAEEDKRGEPFVGRAGQLLNSMLAAIGQPRERVYIANILKCRPPNNRDPRPEEVVCCEAYLQRQIALLKPKLILAVGRIAAQNLLKVETPIGKLRGQEHRFGRTGIPLIVTYHPAYLLRSPGEKRRAWQDLLLAERIYRQLP